LAAKLATIELFHSCSIHRDQTGRNHQRHRPHRLSVDYTTRTHIPAGARLFYVYTNSGEEGKWEGLNVREVRSFNIEASKKGEKVYRPIESFGKIYMQGDPWHTNAAGYELIAKTLTEVLKKDQKVKAYLLGR